MDNEFLNAVKALEGTTEAFNSGRIGSWPHAHQREAALCKALTAMANTLGVVIEAPTAIDSRGEVRVVTARGAQGAPGAAPFGAEFSVWLNTANPRTGVAPGAVLLPESGWCYLNHFNVENLVRRYAETLKAVTA